MLTVTALMDDQPPKNEALIYEHGLSFLVEREDVRVLFDCGASDAVCCNAQELRKNLSNLDAVVLSHSHYDHAAGYRFLIERNQGSQILYTGEHFFERKYAVDGDHCRDLSAGFGTEFLKQNQIVHRECKDRMQIAPGIHLIGNFPRVHKTETIPNRFVKNGFEKDDFADEICMAIEMEKGVLMLAGCSHPGILNMTEWVYKQLNQPIYGVLGGTHLIEANRARVEDTVLQLERMGVQLLGLSHCSGIEAERIIREHAAVQSCHLTAGDVLSF